MISDSENTLTIANLAFEAWKTGLTTGNWEAFLNLLTEDFSFSFPVGKYQGIHQGKDSAKEFFEYVSKIYSEGLQIDLKRTLQTDQTVIFEIESSGQMLGQAYHNQASVFFEVRDEKICHYREYLAVFYRINP
jgi:ketosteroid isomerase-like protein